MTEQDERPMTPRSPGYSKAVEASLQPLYAAAQLGLPHLVDEDEVRKALSLAGYPIKSEDERRVRLPAFTAPVVNVDDMDDETFYEIADDLEPVEGNWPVMPGDDPEEGA